MRMILDLVKGTEWEQLSSYLSPSFFDVVPFLGVTRQVSSLLRRATERSAFERVRTAHWKQHRGIPGLLPAAAGRAGEKVAAYDAPTPQALVELFFAELHRFPESILDLRAKSFADAAWHPAPLWTTWDAGFIHSLRDLYRGFYTDDAPLFDAALRALDLLHAKELFIRHFGGNNQRAVEFRLADFKETFHQVFLSCRKHHARLHPNFLPLGALLGGLYEHLETVQAGPVDVRLAYERFASALPCTV